MGRMKGKSLCYQLSNSPNYDFSKTRTHATLKAMKTIPQGLLDKAIDRLKAEFQPDEIFLYGSHAWGTPHDNSDVDLLVIVPESEEPPIRRAQRAHRCLRGLRLPKDVLVETRQEINRVKHLRASLENAILNRGRRLYG
jgi:predicted nucleotidyltransferase